MATLIYSPDKGYTPGYGGTTTSGSTTQGATGGTTQTQYLVSAQGGVYELSPSGYYDVSKPLPTGQGITYTTSPSGARIQQPGQETISAPTGTVLTLTSTQAAPAPSGISGITPTIITSPGFQAKLEAATASGLYPSQAVRTLTPSSAYEAVPGPIGFSPATNPVAYAAQKTIGLGKDVLSNLSSPWVITEKASGAASAIKSGFKEFFKQGTTSVATQTQPIYSDITNPEGTAFTQISSPVTTRKGFVEAMVTGTAAGMLYAPFVDIKMPGGLLARGRTVDEMARKTEADKLKAETEADRLAKSASKMQEKFVPKFEIVGTEATTRTTPTGMPKVVESIAIIKDTTPQGTGAVYLYEAQLNKIIGTTGALPTERFTGGGTVFRIELPKTLTSAQISKMSYGEIISIATTAKVFPESKAFAFRQNLISKELVSITRQTPTGDVWQSSGVAMGRAEPTGIFKVSKAGEFIKTRGKLPPKSVSGAYYTGTGKKILESPDVDVQSWAKFGQVKTIFKGVKGPPKIATIGGTEEVYISKVSPTKIISFPRSYNKQPGLSLPKIPEIYGKQGAGTIPTTTYVKVAPSGSEILAYQAKEMLGQFLAPQIRTTPARFIAPTKAGYGGYSFPISRQVSMAKTISSEAVFLREIPAMRSQTGIKAATGTAQISISIPKESQWTYTPSAERVTTSDITQQIQRQTTTTVTRTTDFTTTFNPPGTPPPFTWPQGFGPEMGYAYGRSKKSRRKYKCVPSFGAVIFKIFGRQPKKKTFTGFEARPVVGFSKRMQNILKGL